MQIGVAQWKTVWKFHKKLKMERPYGRAIPLLGIEPKKQSWLPATGKAERVRQVLVQKERGFTQAL